MLESRTRQIEHRPVTYTGTSRPWRGGSFVPIQMGDRHGGPPKESNLCSGSMPGGAGVEPGVPVLERTADGSTRRRVEGSAVVGFFAAVCEALVELGPRLRRCDPAPEKNDSGRKYCSKYVAVVGHYRYCSATCSQRVRSRRYDDRPAAGGGSLLR